MFEWDDDRRAANLVKHGVDVADEQRLDWANAMTTVAARTDYGEARFVTLGLIDGRLHFCAWTRREDRRRIISLRKANKREQALFAP